MAIASARPQTSYDEWRDRRWRLTGVAFAVLWLVTSVVVGLNGEKRSDLGNLEAAIADGSVAQVEVVGLPAGADWRGRAQVTLEWQATVLKRFAEVTVDTRRHPGDHQKGDLIVGDPADHLRANAPELEVTYSELTGFQEWRGWRGPGWAALLVFVAWFGTFLLAVSGPEPWRATRWGWGWLALLGGPVGCLGFLVLGGPLGLWRPARLDRRLSGGWAFVLAMLVLGGSNTA